jgi:hypothetical protein
MGLGLLAACAVTPTAPRIQAVTPAVLQQDKPATVTVSVTSRSSDQQLVLSPAGPYPTHRLALDSPPRALVSDGRWVWLATAAGEIQVVEFPDQAEARLIGHLSLPGVRALAVARQRLLAVLDDGELRLFDVSRPAVPRLLTHQLPTGRVRDLQFDGDTAYLLRDGGVLQEWRFAADDPPRLSRQWRLPVPATAMVVRDARVWLVTPQGVSLVALADDGMRQLDHYETTGIASDVQLRGDQILVADGRGGLVVFDARAGDRLHWLGSFNKRGAINAFAATDTGAVLSLANGSVLAVGLANPELPASGGAFRPASPALLLASHGDALLLATDRDVQRVMMTNGAGAISPEGVNLGGSRRGVIRDDILYVADWFSGLHLYDISLPWQPRHLANYHTPGSSKGVLLLDDYALVADDDQGLQIIDISEPRHPVWRAELPPEAMAGLGLAYTLKRVGKHLYLADHRGGFHIIDLSAIRHPRRLGGYDTPGKSWAIDVQEDSRLGRVAFVADDTSGLLVFDVNDPAWPQLVGSFDPGGQAEDVVLRDGLAYVAFFDKGLYVLDVGDPRQPRLLGHVPIPGNARSIDLVDDLAYVAGWESGLQIVDIHDPAAPRIIGRFDTDGAAWGVTVKDGYAYVLDWWGGLKVVDVRQPSRPAYVGRYHARGTLQRLRTRNHYLYAASGAGGLQVFDIQNPLNPIWVNGLDIEGQSGDLWLDGDRAYVAAGDGGVVMLDILDPFYTRQIGAWNTPGEARLVRAHDDYLYIADSRDGLLVVDVHDPQRPVAVARHPIYPHDLWLDNERLWAATADGLVWWRFGDDGDLTVAGRWEQSGGFRWVRSRDEWVAAATADGALQLWQATAQGLNPQGEYVAGEPLSDLQLANGTLYLLTRSGLLTLDIRGVPQPVAIYSATGRHTHLAVTQNAAFFAGETTLASVRLLPPIEAGRDPVTGAPNLHLPAGLPRGDYHLQLRDPAGVQPLQSHALKVQRMAPGLRRFGLDAMRDLLKSPLKPPPEP